MRILVKEQGAVISDVVVDKPPVHIGSNSSCGVHLPDMRVGSQHAVVTMTDKGQWVVQPLEGHAKTLINGHVLLESKKLSNGDQISIQDFTLNVYLDFQEHDLEMPAEIADGSVGAQYPVPFGTITKSGRHDIQLTPEQLDSFAEFSVELTVCADVPGVIDCTLSGLMKRFQPRMAWIGVRRKPGEPLESMQGVDYQGDLQDVPKLSHSLEYRCLERGLSVWVPKLDDPDTGSVIASPLCTALGRLGYIYLDSKKDGSNFSEDDFHHLMALASLIANQLNAVILKQARFRQATTRAEGNVVQAIQKQLDPRLVPDWKNLHVAIHCSPGEENVGDVYDVMQVPGGAAAFLVGHVFASQVVAAVAMIEARTAFRIAVLHADMPNAVLSELNWLLCNQPEAIIMDCAIVMIDPRTGALLYSLAGYARAAVISQAGSVRKLGGANIMELGKSSDSQFTTRKGLLGKKESLAMFTPGVLKLQDAQGQPLEEQEVLDSLCDGFGMAARAALDETISDLNPYITSGYQPDDITILLAHREGE